MARSNAAKSRLVAVEIHPDQQTARYGSVKRRSRATRWAVKVATETSGYGDIPGLSDILYPSYSEALRAINDFQDTIKDL